MKTLAEADTKFMQGDYCSSGVIYQAVIDRGDVSSSELLHSRYRLGVCYFHQGEYRKAVNCYEGFLFDKKGSRDVYMEQVYTLAMSYLQLNDFEKSLEYFDEFVHEESSDYYYVALVSKSTILNILGGREEEVLKLNNEVIKAYEDGENVGKYAVSAAFSSLGAMYEKTNDKLAYEYYIKSSNAAVSKDKVLPIINALKIDQTDVSVLWEGVLDALSTGEIKLDSEIQSIGLVLSSAKLLPLISIGISSSMHQEVERLLSCIKEKCLEDVHNYSEVILELALMSFRNTKYDDAKYLLNKILHEDRELVSPESHFEASKFLSYMGDADESVTDCYFKGFQNYVDSVDVIDVVLFERKISEFLRGSEFEKAEKYADLIIGFEGLRSYESRLKLLTILFLKMRSINEQSGKLQQAYEIKRIIDETKKEDILRSHITETTLKGIKKETERTIVTMTPIEQVVRRGVRYGRNDRVVVEYEDGRTEEKKYKYVKDSIVQGICRILET